jgi:hypothetical protein
MTIHLNLKRAHIGWGLLTAAAGWLWLHLDFCEVPYRATVLDKFPQYTHSNGQVYRVIFYNDYDGATEEEDVTVGQFYHQYEIGKTYLRYRKDIKWLKEATLRAH